MPAIIFHRQVQSRVKPTEDDDLVRLQDIKAGEPGFYIAGTDFDGGGLPSLQEFLDEHINDHRFTGTVTIDGGNVPRTDTIVIRNLLMQGETLHIESRAQFAGSLTIVGVLGSVQISGSWGSANNFASSLSVQNVVGTVNLAGGSGTQRFHDVSFFGCLDVRIDPGWNNQSRIDGTLIISHSNVLLNGQGSATHSYNRTNINAGARLDITSTLSATAVTLDRAGGTGARSGWILDRRQNQTLETFRRRDGGSDGGTFTGTLAGDVTGEADATVVVRLRGRALSTVVPEPGNVLMWTGSFWTPMPLPIWPPGGATHFDDGVSRWDDGHSVWT